MTDRLPLILIIVLALAGFAQSQDAEPTIADIVVEGGVTRQNIAVQFGFWQQNLERVKQALMRHLGKAPDVVLH